MKNSKKYTKDGTTIQAIKLTRESWAEVQDWLGDSYIRLRTSRVQVFIKTASGGTMVALDGDYVIKNAEEDFVSAKGPAFEAQYKANVVSNG